MDVADEMPQEDVSPPQPVAEPVVVATKHAASIKQDQEPDEPDVEETLFEEPEPAGPPREGLFGKLRATLTPAATQHAEPALEITEEVAQEQLSEMPNAAVPVLAAAAETQPATGSTQDERPVEPDLEETLFEEPEPVAPAHNGLIGTLRANLTPAVRQRAEPHLDVEEDPVQENIPQMPASAASTTGARPALKPSVEPGHAPAPARQGNVPSRRPLGSYSPAPMAPPAPTPRQEAAAPPVPESNKPSLSQARQPIPRPETTRPAEPPPQPTGAPPSKSPQRPKTIINTAVIDQEELDGLISSLLSEPDYKLP